MQPSIGAAVLLSFQPLYVPTITYVVPQASVWPGVPGVQGQGAQLPPGELPPSVGQLPPWGLHPAMAPPTAPAHGCIHHLQAGPWPGAVLHGEPPQPAGSCPLQDPHRHVLLPAPPVQQQVLPAPCTLPSSRERAVGPFGDAVVLTEDRGHPAPTDACPQPSTAPLGCSGAALEAGGEFGGCRAGGRLSAPGGKAGTASLGMVLLFQQ